MIMIDYTRFLSMRFDLVIRYYLLGMCEFDARKARHSIMEDVQHKHLRNAFAQLLKMDVAENEMVKAKLERHGITEEFYDRRVSKALFSMKGWSWVEKQMIKGDEWIRKNPYPIMRNGLGTSVKRLILALRYGRTLYWQYRGDRVLFRLWGQGEYEKLLRPSEYREIMKAKDAIVDRMGELGFFSSDTYIEENKI